MPVVALCRAIWYSAPCNSPTNSRSCFLQLAGFGPQLPHHSLAQLCDEVSGRRLPPPLVCELHEVFALEQAKMVCQLGRRHLCHPHELVETNAWIIRYEEDGVYPDSMVESGVNPELLVGPFQTLFLLKLFALHSTRSRIAVDVARAGI